MTYTYGFVTYGGRGTTGDQTAKKSPLFGVDNTPNPMRIAAMQHNTTPDEIKQECEAAEREYQEATAELRRIADEAEVEARLALGTAISAHMRYAAAELESRAAHNKAEEAREKLARSPETDYERAWCRGDKRGCMGDCGGRFHDIYGGTLTSDTYRERTSLTEDFYLSLHAEGRCDDISARRDYMHAMRIRG